MKIESPFEDFGSLLFDEKLMKERLPYPSYKVWTQTVLRENMLDRNTADDIAHAMKRWALENGCTHFTHWFQPMTGSTAEKHDAFVEPDEFNQPLLRFSGKSLIKGEPDASSFPNGGLRNTFEARGYTYWDCTSPAFIRDNILCIPTVFVSYTGESLDKKAPLLKSCEAISNAATKIVNIFGDKEVKKVDAMVGLEQEYFLIDSAYYQKRMDLSLCGRTLFGDLPLKGQEMADHYFGSIPTRVAAFMKELNQECWKLGIYAKAEHNETAPAQFEIAPVYASCNVAVDQNQIMMELLQKIAEKHHFACLLHEKPFQGINGSGKHNNWSLMSDDGQNLFEPGDKPSENVRFLVFVCAFLKAVDTYPELLRLSASGPGNDHRLGANEAPPAIISVYLGSVIENILLNLESSKKIANSDNSESPFAPISGLSYIPKDNTDRNRTSPMAFTGNKFEFRMLGSSLSSATANTVLNTIMADTLNEIAKELEDLKYKQNIRAKAMEICKRIISEHKRILFSGDGYSDEWVQEAKRRGLPNIPTFVESIEYNTAAKTIELYQRNNIYTEKECEARSEILYEQSIKIIDTESKTLISMIQKQIIPFALKHLQQLAQVPEQSLKTKYFMDTIDTLNQTIAELDEVCTEIKETSMACMNKNNTQQRATSLSKQIVPLLQKARDVIDQYEKIAPRECYGIPTYDEMLFKF